MTVSPSFGRGHCHPMGNPNRTWPAGDGRGMPRKRRAMTMETPRSSTTATTAASSLSDPAAELADKVDAPVTRARPISDARTVPLDSRRHGSDRRWANAPASGSLPARVPAQYQRSPCTPTLPRGLASRDWAFRAEVYGLTRQCRSGAASLSQGPEGRRRRRHPLSDNKPRRRHTPCEPDALRRSY